MKNVKQEVIAFDSCNSDSLQSGQFFFVSCGTDSDECMETTEETENGEDESLAGEDVNRLDGEDNLDHSTLLSSVVISESLNNKLLLVTDSHNFYNNIIRKNSGQEELTDSDTERYECKVCLKSFEKLSHLESHKLFHFGMKLYLCDICNRSFSSLATLKLHKQTHNFVKRYKCEMCDKTFSQRQQEINHRTTHSGEKKYKCNVCDKSFCHSSTLSRHRLSHSSVEKFVCEVCNKIFLKPSSLIKHRFTHKKEEDIITTTE